MIHGDAFIVDPNEFDKEDSFYQGITYTYRFLKKNKLSYPKKILTESKQSKWRSYGWYQFQTHTLCVNLNKTRCPVKNPGFAWSYTGFKADLTPVGVLAHEIGHHVHNAITPNRIAHKELLKLIRKVSKNESSVSSYEPNSYEVFAESMRLFILNPELLREGRPVRWTLLHECCNLQPMHDIHWREILKNAHPKIINSVENWIKKGK